MTGAAGDVVAALGCLVAEHSSAVLDMLDIHLERRDAASLVGSKRRALFGQVGISIEFACVCRGPFVQERQRYPDSKRVLRLLGLSPTHSGRGEAFALVTAALQHLEGRLSA